MKLFAAATALFSWICSVASHGRFMEPPSRASLWRFMHTDPAIIPYASIVEPNYNDNELFCGGFQHQQNHGGRCGICGDPWDGEREHEAQGKYGKGIIVRKYAQGSLMDITIDLTAHHLGFFEIRLCEQNFPEVPATQECLNSHLLLTEAGDSKYYPDQEGVGGTSKGWRFKYKVQLPPDVTCTQCVVQWRYHAGNNWGCDSNEGCCLGCGAQEEFYGCADVAIGSEPTLPPPGWNEVPTTTTTTASSSSLSPSSTLSTTTTTSASPTTTTTSSATTTTTSTPSSNEPSCNNKPEGKYKLDCNSYYTCGNAGAGPYVYPCPPATVYDVYRQICDHTYNVPPECGTKEPGT